MHFSLLACGAFTWQSNMLFKICGLARVEEATVIVSLPTNESSRVQGGPEPPPAAKLNQKPIKMQKVLITKENDPNQGRIGLAEVVSEGIAVYVNFEPQLKLYGYNEIKVVGNVTVYDATRLAFNGMREFFPVLDMVRAVRRITGREYLMDGTILRRLRELREDGFINYEVFDTQKAKYKKL